MPPHSPRSRRQNSAEQLVKLARIIGLGREIGYEKARHCCRASRGAGLRRTCPPLLVLLTAGLSAALLATVLATLLLLAGLLATLLSAALSTTTLVALLILLATLVLSALVLRRRFITIGQWVTSHVQAIELAGILVRQNSVARKNVRKYIAVSRNVTF